MQIAILIICSVTLLFIFVLFELMFKIRDEIEAQIKKVYDELWDSKYKIVKRQPEQVDSETSEEIKEPDTIKNIDGN